MKDKISLYGILKGIVIPLGIAGACVSAYALGRASRSEDLTVKLKEPTAQIARDNFKQEKTQAQISDIVQEKSQASRDCKDYSEFEFQDEIPGILETAKEYGIEPEMLMAVRMAENGGSYAYGVLPRRKSEKETFKKLDVQREKCAESIRNNLIRLQSAEPGKYSDWIDFMGDRYCPVGAGNDPNDLNENWERNVRSIYESLRGER